MDQHTVAALLKLNHGFYREFAGVFAASRPVSDAALTCILPYIPPRASVLDVGCGNGRLAFLLDVERPGACYVGLDAVEELMTIARTGAAELTAVAASFHVLDVALPGWGAELQDALGGAAPASGFDVAVALAVLHHIPGRDRRAALLREMAGLLHPRGRLIVSTWQFLESTRLQRKLVDWSEVGLTAQQLEPGDYLIDWRRGGRGLRYCHLVDEGELRQLADLSHLAVRHTFRAGGQQGNLSLFAVLELADPGG